MRRVWLAGVPLVYVLLAACVGDDPGINSSVGPDGGTPLDEITTGHDGSTPGDVDANGDASSDGATAEKRCGYPGEDCCSAPSLPCREGTVCGTANQKCMVSDVGIVGTNLEVQNGSTFTRHVSSAFFDGKDWTIGPDVMTEASLSGFSPTDLIAGGPQNYEVTLFKSSEGKMFNYYSSAWRKCEPGQACAGPTLPPPAFWSVARIANDTWIGATNAIYRCAAGSTCTKEVAGLESTTWGTGKLVGTGPQDIWFSALSRAFHFDGTKWTIHDNIKARTIFQIRKDDVWVGDKTLQHWDGTKWSDEYVIDGQPAPGIITSISGSSDSDVWAVGYNPSDGAHPAFAAHWDGMTWKLVPLPAGAAEGPSIYAPSPIEAFLVVSSGVYRWDGNAWKTMTLPTVDAGSGGQPMWAYVAGVAKPRP
ncbi:hypothetical protein AKJ09_01859 [Labilithrix luteola]|uniref:Type IV fimbrial biogenesis protein PilY1 n=1 Tax=Labilithrix luteola TaxID=1391654 RepID=A0A0K1PNS6_9BACT|nr:hypothetical protein [Labilithrix luteola]AKU95195.1 hypothetical protein AKJ09_01859 [Labilithrix luteola]